MCIKMSWKCIKMMFQWMFSICKTSTSKSEITFVQLWHMQKMWTYVWTWILLLFGMFSFLVSMSRKWYAVSENDPYSSTSAIQPHSAHNTYRCSGVISAGCRVDLGVFSDTRVMNRLHLCDMFLNLCNLFLHIGVRFQQRKTQPETSRQHSSNTRG